MPLLNWPPSKGPKPAWMRCQDRYEIPRPGRKEFVVHQSSEAAAERRSLLEAVMEFHPVDDRDVKRIPKAIDQVGASTLIPPRSKRPRRKPKAEREFQLRQHLVTVGLLEIDQAEKVIQGYGVKTRRPQSDLPVRPLTFELTYPLTRGVNLTVKPYRVVRTFGDNRMLEKRFMSIGYSLWMIAQEYFRIYKHWKRYKIWGHGIEDLYFERLQILSRNRAEIFVGSL